ncbi:MAG: hypothetical protein AB7I27_16900 [Bacteriovoracaceae bacterium]
MQRILIIFLFLTFGYAHANLGDSGFKILEDNKVFMHLQFHSNLELLISKERFSEKYQAYQFCKKHESSLDTTEFYALLISLSGASGVNEFLKRAITFKIGLKSGIWQWSEGHKVIMLYNGHTQKVQIEDLNRGKKISLPAICTKD